MPVRSPSATNAPRRDDSVDGRPFPGAQDRGSRSKSEWVYLQLLEEIVSGRYSVGQRLPSEADLCTSLEVSRTAVREALSRLRADGLVVSRHGSGSFVHNQPPRDLLRLMPIGDIGDLLQWHDIRTALECEITLLAAERRTNKDLALIRAALDALIHQDPEAQGGMELDYQFHLALARATHNELFVLSMESLYQHIQNWIRAVRNRPQLSAQERQDIYEGEHAAIFEAVSRQDPLLAQAAMRRHLSEGRIRLLRRAGTP